MQSSHACRARASRTQTLCVLCMLVLVLHPDMPKLAFYRTNVVPVLARYVVVPSAYTLAGLFTGLTMPVIESVVDDLFDPDKALGNGDFPGNRVFCLRSDTLGHTSPWSNDGRFWTEWRAGWAFANAANSTDIVQAVARPTWNIVRMLLHVIDLGPRLASTVVLAPLAFSMKASVDQVRYKLAHSLCQPLGYIDAYKYHD